MKQLRLSILLVLASICISLPTHAQFGKLLNKAKSTADKAREITETPSEAVTNSQAIASDVKPAKISIYFAPHKFAGTTESAKTDFTEGEYIYGRILLSKPAKEYLDENGNLTINMGYKHSGEDNFTGLNIMLDGSRINKDATQVDFDVLPLPSEASTFFAEYMQAPSLINMAMQAAKPNTKTEFLMELGDLQGHFYLSIKNNKTFDAFVKPIQQKVLSLQRDAEAMTAELPPELNEKSYAFNDPQLSKEKIINALPDNIQLFKMVIGPGNDYTVIKNDLGVILRKQSARYIYVVYKDKETGNCFCEQVIFDRDYEGNGQYGPLTSHRHGDRIDCSKVK